MKIKLFLTIALILLHANLLKSEDFDKELSFYTGTFDVIDKEGDDQTSMFGIEHRNPELFRNTFLGKISPITGGFITGKNSMFFYTGVEANYGLGPIKLKPSFTPGYYESGDGKDLGAALEFKSEIKLDFEIFENSKDTISLYFFIYFTLNFFNIFITKRTNEL